MNEKMPKSENVWKKNKKDCKLKMIVWRKSEEKKTLRDRLRSKERSKSVTKSSKRKSSNAIRGRKRKPRGLPRIK